MDTQRLISHGQKLTRFAAIRAVFFVFQFGYDKPNEGLKAKCYNDPQKGYGQLKGFQQKSLEIF